MGIKHHTHRSTQTPLSSPSRGVDLITSVSISLHSRNDSETTWHFPSTNPYQGLMLPPSQSSCSLKRDKFSSSLIVHPFCQIKPFIKWVVFLEQMITLRLTLPAWSKSHQIAGPWCHFCQPPHWGAMTNWQRGHICKKKSWQRLCLLSFHIMKGWKKRCHFTVEMQMGRLLLAYQDSWGRICDDNTTSLAFLIPLSPPDIATISTATTIVKWHKDSWLLLSRLFINRMWKKVKKISSLTVPRSTPVSGISCW